MCPTCIDPFPVEYFTSHVDMWIWLLFARQKKEKKKKWRIAVVYTSSKSVVSVWSVPLWHSLTFVDKLRSHLMFFKHQSVSAVCSRGAASSQWAPVQEDCMLCWSSVDLSVVVSGCTLHVNRTSTGPCMKSLRCILYVFVFCKRPQLYKYVNVHNISAWGPFINM